MQREWFGITMGLALVTSFGACSDDVDVAEPSGTGDTATTTSDGGSGQGGDGSGALGGNGAGGEGQGASGGMGQGGGGGSAECGSVPPPDGGLICGGTSATTGGGTQCETSCSDQSANDYSVICYSDTGTCECRYNDETMCTCQQDAFGCSDHCCPAPFDQLDGGGSGSGGSGSTSGSTVSVGSTGGG